MLFKSNEDQFVVMYRDDGLGYKDYPIQKDKIVHIDFTVVVESYFNFDVLSGSFEPMDDEAHQWVCDHLETAC